MESSIIVKAFKILEAIAAESGCGLAALSQKLEMTKPTVHRIVGDLVGLGFVRRDENGHYLPAEALWRLMPGASSRLLAAAEPVMRKLWRRTHETVNLGVLSGQKIRYVRVLNSDLPLRRDVTPGDQDPVLTTALGRILVSRLSQDEQEWFLESLPRQLTPFTLTTRDSLQVALRQASDKGYAIDDQETDLGVCCVAAPIEDSAGDRAALSLSLPTARLELRGGIDEIGALISRAAAAISRRLNESESTGRRPRKIQSKV